MIEVNKPFLPPEEEYSYYVRDIFKRNWLTNNGPLVKELESQLKAYLETEHLLYLNNGTIALQIAIKALDLKGEIITTPFSFVATTASIVWENCTPVFIDINEDTWNINSELIEAAITERTTAILATHVFGNPCDIDKIEEIALRHNLKVIYDAAHCFGTKYNGRSVFGFGDISTTSFHATKLFHTIEGGAVFASKPEIIKMMAQIRNFGYDGPYSFSRLGVNGKNSEFHAAMGLCNLKYINEILIRRKEASYHYTKALEGLKVKKQLINPNCEYNYSYYPILFHSEEHLLIAIKELEKHKVYGRRYFYPSLNTLNYVHRQDTPISEDISKRIFCLPLFFDISKEDIDMICGILLRLQNN